MITPDVRRSSFRSTAIPIGIVSVIAGYLLAAFIFGFWPMPHPPVAVCPAAATYHQIFVDPTASNEHTENWKTEAHAFAQNLGSCDQASFGMITDNSSSGAQFGDPLAFPLIDRNASIAEVRDAENKIRDMRSETERRIAQMMREHGAKRSDIVGIFFKLKPVENRRNVLDVFSDGKESGARINLEDGHTCVTPGNVADLVDLAVRDRPLKSAIGAFQTIEWVIPDRSGKRGCNSRDELQLFWTGVITRLAEPGSAPAVRFDTNLF